MFHSLHYLSLPFPLFQDLFFFSLLLRTKLKPSHIGEPPYYWTVTPNLYYTLILDFNMNTPNSRFYASGKYMYSSLRVNMYRKHCWLLSISPNHLKSVHFWIFFLHWIMHIAYNFMFKTFGSLVWCQFLEIYFDHINKHSQKKIHFNWTFCEAEWLRNWVTVECDLLYVNVTITIYPELSLSQ